MSLSILALRTRKNELEQVTLELIGKAKRFYPGEINIILPVGDEDCSSIIRQTELAGANKIYLIKNSILSMYSTIPYKVAVLKALDTIKPEIFLTGATTNGRDLAPRIAASSGYGLTADCTELAMTEENKLAATRPTFGGSLMATILSRTDVQMATVRPGVFKKPQNDVNNHAEIIEINTDIENQSDNIEELNFITKNLIDSSIEAADVIVAGGKGIKNQETFKLLEELALLLGGKTAASRGLVETGICDNNIQVGQTGKTVTPKIYIACGISGAIQHIEGMKNSQTIIAINKDEDAPIFKISDYKIIGDVSEVVQGLINEIKRNKNEK